MKKLLVIFVVLILVLIAAVVSIPILFKGQIIEAFQEEANKNLNAKLEFNDLNLSLISNFPNVSADIEDLSVVGIDTFAIDTLVSFEKFKATLDLMSLISGDEIKVKQLILDKPNVNIKILQNGISNYDIAKEDTTVKEKNIEDSSEDSKFKINLDKFEIKNGNVIYDDRKENIYASIKNINYVLSGDMTEKLTNLDMKLIIDALTVKSGGITYLNKTKTTFNSEIEADIENSKYTFKENTFTLNEINLGFDGYLEMPEEDIIMDFTFKTKKAKFKDVLSMIPAIYKKDFADVKTSGKFKLNGYVKGTMTEELMPAYGINLLVDNAFFKYPDLPKSVENINVNLKVDAEAGTGDNITIDVKNANLTMANNPISIKTFIKMTKVDIAMRGNIKGKVDFNTIKDVVPTENMKLTGTLTTDINFKGNMSDIENEDYEKFDANGNLTVEKMNIDAVDMPKVNIQKANMNFSPQFVDLKQFDAIVGKSDLHLVGKIKNIFSYIFKDELLTGTFDFNSGFLDVDELMKASESDPEGQETENKTDETEVIEIPSNLDFTLNSRINKIKYDKLSITNAVGKIIIKDSKLDMKNLKMNMLGGAMTMNGSYDSKKLSEPLADLNMSISNFNISETFKAFTSIKAIAPIIENCTGNISADISLKSILDTEMMPVLKTIMSSGSINSNNISISNNSLLGKLAGKTKQNKFKSPRVNNLNLKYIIDKGILNVLPTDFKIAGTKVNFGGTQSLDKKLDFNLGMLLPKGVAGALVSKLNIGKSQENVDVTAKIGGTSDKPKIVGFSSALTDGLKDEVVKKVEEVKDKVNKQAKKILDDAKKQADKIIKLADNQANNIRKTAKKSGDKLISEAEYQGNQMIKKASNPIAKKLAQEAKKKLVNEAKGQARTLNSKADKEAKKVINVAKAKSDKIMTDARRKAKL